MGVVVKTLARFRIDAVQPHHIMHIAAESAIQKNGKMQFFLFLHSDVHRHWFV